MGCCFEHKKGSLTIHNYILDIHNSIYPSQNDLLVKMAIRDAIGNDIPTSKNCISFVKLYFT